MEYDEIVTLFSNYMHSIRKLSSSSVKHYVDGLKTVSKYLVKNGLVDSSIYEINDIDRLKVVYEILISDPEFIRLDDTGHKMYSNAIKRYMEFAVYDDFSTIDVNNDVIDIPVRRNNKIYSTVNQWKRSNIVRRQAIQLANNRCEIDCNHKSFIAEKDKKLYMEGHHAIPIKYQEKFTTSIDVYANVICLCPICHRKIHYGLTSDVDIMSNYIYELRKDRLLKSGIRLSKEEFRDYVNSNVV